MLGINLLRSYCYRYKKYKNNSDVDSLHVRYVKFLIVSSLVMVIEIHL